LLKICYIQKKKSNSISGSDFEAFEKEVPMKFCSFGCPKAVNEKAQHAACLAVNGVFCGELKKVVEKGTPCPIEQGRGFSKASRKKTKS
jgi:hypothetical protein